MTIRRQAGLIVFSFDEPDWNHPAGGAQSIIKSVKADIPVAQFAVDGRGYRYDPETKCWSVPDEPTYVELIESYKTKYLTDKRQGQLFNGA